MAASSWLERQWWQRPATPIAHALRPLAALYGALTRIDRAFARPSRLEVPVVVVGNLVAGGAGKTPTTIELVRALRRRGWSPGVVSRGYGRTTRDVAEVTPASLAADVGDEPLLIARRTACPVFVGARRIDAARALRQRYTHVDIVVADDGLQHHRLARDAQVIVIDERGFGNGLLLPAGPLRERPPPVPPPRSVVVYNAGAPTTPWPGSIVQCRLAGAVPLAAWVRGAAPEAAGLAALRGKQLVAAAGIAAPQRFFAMLAGEGLAFETRPRPDHDDWRQWPTLANGQDLLVTEKDAVKLDPRSPLAARTWVVPLDFVLPAELVDTLLALLSAPDNLRP